MKIRRILLSAVIAAGCIFGTTGCKKSSSSGNIGDVTLQDGDIVAEIVIENYGTISAKLFPDIAPKAVENFIQLANEGYYDGLKIHRVAPGHFMQGGSLNGDGTGGSAVIDESGEFDIETSLLARNFYGALGYANVNGKNTTQFYIINNSTPSVDYNQLDPAAFTALAEEYSAQLEGLDSSDADYDQLTSMVTHYTNLAQMIEKATDEVKEKYNTVGGDPTLDGGYTVFGQVYEGFDVIDAIAAVELGMNNSNEQTKPMEDIIIETVNIITVSVGTEESDSSSGTNSPASNASEPDTLADTAEAKSTVDADLPDEAVDIDAPFNTVETGE